MVAIFTPIYDRVLAWSKHAHAQWYLAVLSFIEAIFFPIPPDVMLAPMVLANRARAWWLAFVTTLASVLGGVVGYVLGFWALELVLPIIEQAGYGAGYEHAVAAFQKYGTWFVILAGFSPIPFKAITIAAGAMGMPWLGFIVGCIVGRGARFFMVAGIIYAGGERAAEHLRSWVDRIGWAVVAVALFIALVWLTGCTTTNTPAPIVHRSGMSAQGLAVAPATYAVKSGESLYSIAFRYGLDWQDVAAWNDIDPPYMIKAGQRLRLRAPVGPRVSARGDEAQTPSRSAGVETQPLRPAGSVEARSAIAPVPTPRSSAMTTLVRAPEASGSAVTRRVEGLDWRWPVAGRLDKPFDPSATRKGIGIGGQAGAQIVAAAPGEVVYSGTALIGYGELIIIKHSDSLLSAYGYNRKRLVEEGMRVEAGAPIAEIGQNTEGQWQLHFEIRRNGEAVDPRAFLPPTIQ